MGKYAELVEIALREVEMSTDSIISVPNKEQLMEGLNNADGPE